METLEQRTTQGLDDAEIQKSILYTNQVSIYNLSNLLSSKTFDAVMLNMNMLYHHGLASILCAIENDEKLLSISLGELKKAYESIVKNSQKIIKTSKKEKNKKFN